MIPELFWGVKGFDLKTQLNTDDLHFEDSYKRNNEVTRADAGGWLVIMLVIFMVFAIILSSVAQWYYKKESDRRLSEGREKNKQRRQSAQAAVQAATSLEHVLDTSSASNSPLKPKKSKRRQPKLTAFDKFL